MSKGNQDLDKILKYLNFKNIIQFCAFIVFCFAVIRLYLSINNSFRIFSFDDFGYSLDRRFFDKYGLNIYSKLLNNYGLNDENDNIKFIINIRTDDASDDCKIKGKYRDGKLRSIHIDGDGEKCSVLRENN